MTGEPCPHCTGSGRCDQTCCTIFGLMTTLQTTDGLQAVYVCAVCRGTKKQG